MNSLAIITGASRGIGLAAASRFLHDGWQVINLSRTPCPLSAVEHIACDLTDEPSLHTALRAIDLSAYTRVSIIHNAATIRRDNYADLTAEDFTRVWQLNVLAPQIINQHLLAKLPPDSSVIFIGSTLSDIGVPGRLSYVTTKHALAGMMKATCQDLAGKAIHTCLICPGFTDTQMLHDSLSIPGDIQSIENMVLFNRLITPEEIAQMVHFCALNPVINGAVLHANLGQRS